MIETKGSDFLDKNIETLSEEIDDIETFSDVSNPKNTETSKDNEDNEHKFESPLANVISEIRQKSPWVDGDYNIYDDGRVLIEGYAYYIGRNLSGSRVCKLNDNIALVISETGQPSHFFTLKEQMPVKDRRDSNYMVLVNRSEINLEPIEKLTDAKQQKDLEKFLSKEVEIAGLKQILFEKLMSDPSKKVREKISQFLIQNPSSAEIYQFSKNLPDFEQMKHYELERLCKEKFIRFATIDGKQIIIANLEKFKNFPGFYFASQAHHKPPGQECNLYNSPLYGDKKVYDTLNNLFGDMEVISEEDYNLCQKDEIPNHMKRLLYFPKNGQDAIDPQAIKQQNFYLGFWESDGATSSYSDNLEFDPKEAALACIILHPQFGDGGYDEKGKLYIRDAQTREYRRFTPHHIIQGYHTHLGTHEKRGGGLGYNNAEFAKKHCRRLIENGLLTYKDFREVSKKEDKRESVHQPYRFSFDREYNIRSNGGCFIDYITYFVGKQNNLQERAVVALLTENLACAYDPTTGEIISTFQLRTLSEIESMDEYIATVKYKGKLGYSLNKKQTAAEPYNENSFYLRRSEETEDQYLNRVNTMSEFKFYLELRVWLQSLTPPIAMETMPYELRKTIIDGREKYSEDTWRELQPYLEKFGEDGFETAFVNQSITGNNGFIKICNKFEDRSSANRLIGSFKQHISQPFLRLINILTHLSSDKESFQLLDKLPQTSNKINTFLDLISKQLAKNPKQNIDEITDKLKLGGEQTDFSDIYYTLLNEGAVLLAQEIGFDANEISGLNTTTQRNFIYFLDKADPEQISDLHSFADRFGVNGLQTFLSLEYGREMGDKILSLSERIDQQTAEGIFAKYSEITQSADSVRQFLHNNLGKEITNSEQIEDEIIEKLLKKGKDLLARYADSPELSPESVMRELDNINTELLLFGDTFKTLRERGENINLEDFTHLAQEITPASELPQDTREELLSIFDRNYSGEENPTEERDAIQSAGRYFRENMVKSFNDPSTNYHIYKVGDTVIAFLRVKDNEDGTSYAGSFNVAPGARSSQIATVLLEKFLDQQCAKRPLKIDATCKLRVATHYVNKNSFICTGISRPDGVETELLQMIRDDRDRREYQYRSISPTDLKKTWLQQNPHNETNLSAQNQILAFDFTDSDQYAYFCSVCSQLFENGYVISNFVLDKEDNSTRYVAFEIPSSP